MINLYFKLFMAFFNKLSIFKSKLNKKLLGKIFFYGIIFIVIIAIYFLTIAFMKQHIKNAVIKAKEEERLACENMIASANLDNQTKTIKTIIKYEKIKNNVSTYDINERSRLLQQIEDFNFAD